MHPPSPSVFAVTVLAGAFALAAPVAAQEVAPEVAAPEATRVVVNQTQYRNALTDLSAITTGTNTIRIGADFALTVDLDPTYTGTRPLRILGGGHTIDGSDLNRLLLQSGTASVTVRNLTFHDGRTPTGNDGGAVSTSGPLTLDRVRLEGNEAESNGGAVRATGLTMTDSVLVGNHAGNVGGAVSNFGPLTVADTLFDANTIGDPLSSSGGGALNHSGGDATITTTTFEDNQVLDDNADGGAVRITGTNAATLTDVTFTGNSTSGARGGAVYATTPLTVTRGEFSDNEVLGADTSIYGGGALFAAGATTITDGYFERNTATGGSGGAVLLDGTNTTAFLVTSTRFLSNASDGAGSGGGGGALFAYDGVVTVTGGEFESNTVSSTYANGGAILTGPGATTTVEDTELVGNSVTGTSGRGGAVYAGGETHLDGLSVVTNHADAASGRGGGVAGGNAPLTVTHSLVSANTTAGSGGSGGGIAGGSLTLDNSLVAGNQSAGFGGGVFTESSQTATIRQSTIDGNAAANGANLATVTSGAITVTASSVLEPQVGVNCYRTGSTLVSSGHNTESATSCGFTQPTDQQNLVDTGIGPLRDNGGPTPSRFPLAGSPLVDHVPSGDCALADDQRRVGRPYGTGCDIGAVEQVFPDHAFSDVPTWVEDAVRWITFASRTPLMEGFDDGTFRAADPITRAQVVRLLYRVAGEPDPSAYGPHPFTDVPSWVEDAVRWAFGEGIVTGETPTTFAPDEPITRAQVVRMVYRLAGSQAVTGIDPHPFTDVPSWVETAVRWAANPDDPLPLITGITPTTFEAAADITRGQVARMIWRLALTPAAWADPMTAPSTVLFRTNLA